MRTDDAVSAAVAAAEHGGLEGEGAEALRVGENGVVLLPAAGALAKVAPGRRQFDDIVREIVVAGWLSGRGVDVARPVLSRPIIVDDCVVSFWEYLKGASSADLNTLARCLRRLHAVAEPPVGLLSPVEPFPRFEERLASATTLDASDRAFLSEFRLGLAGPWASAEFELGTAVIHGDAHMDNLLETPDGRSAFVDLETVSLGPPEWDLTLTALYRECGWFSAEQYRLFVDAYGYDVRSSTEWPVLRGIRMLRITIWLAQSAGDDPVREQQLRHRLSTLRNGTAPAGWSGF